MTTASTSSLPRLEVFPDLVAVLDALLLRHFLGDFDERTRLQPDQGRHVLRHVVLVLGQPIARRDIRVILGGTEAVLTAALLVVQEHDRRFRLLRMERILDRRFDRLVVLGERTVEHRAGRAVRRPRPS